MRSMKKLVEDAASKVEQAAQRVASEVAKRALKHTAQSKLDGAKSYLNRLLGEDEEPKAPPRRSLLEKVFRAESDRASTPSEKSFFGKFFDEKEKRNEPETDADATDREPSERSTSRERSSGPSLTERREALDARAKATAEAKEKLEREVDDELAALRKRVGKK